MKLYIRRILLIVSCVVFAIVAPLIILYAMGYRGELVGVAIIDATPRKAMVEVNGKPYGTLPRSVANLLPGQATVRVTKEGYMPWEKKIEIKPGAATELRSIQLLPSTIERDILVADSALFALSSTSGLIASADIKNNLTIYDDSGVTITSPLPLSGRPIALSWSPNESHLLVTYAKQIYEIVRVERNVSQTIPAPALVGGSSAMWDPTTAGRILLMDTRRSLIAYDIVTKTAEQLAQNINAYAVNDRTILLQTLENELISKRIGNTETQVLASDTAKDAQKIIPGSNGAIALLSADTELRLVTKQKEVRHIAFAVQEALWSPDGTTLLIQTTDGALHTYVPEGADAGNATPGELHLLARLSRTITRPQWLPDSNHILYNVDGNLIFSEIDTRDHAITSVIDTVQNANQYATIESSGKSLLYIQQKEKEPSSLVRSWLVVDNDR